MASADDKELALRLASKAVEVLIRQGLSAPKTAQQDVAHLANQIVQTVDFLAIYRHASPTQLKMHLTSYVIRGSALNAGPRLNCATAIGLLAVSIAEIVLIPGGIVVKAIFLLKDMYETDQACGVSAAVNRKANEILGPHLMEAERSVKELLIRQSSWGFSGRGF